MIELLDYLSDMHIYINKIVEEDGVDISYDDVKDIIKELKELVNNI